MKFIELTRTHYEPMTKQHIKEKLFLNAHKIVYLKPASVIDKDFATLIYIKGEWLRVLETPTSILEQLKSY